MISLPMTRRWKSRAILVSALALALAACSSTATPAAQEPTVSSAATTGVIETAAPVAQPTAAVSTASTAAPAATADAQAAAPSPDAAITAQTQAMAKLNLNDATAEQFLTVPDVGNRMVREFMEYRPYTSILQFRREIGKYVSADQVAAYEQYVFVPVDVNQADAETLMQIPGVDETIAANLIAGRPYNTSADFLAKLTTALSPEQATAAAAYLIAP